MPPLLDMTPTSNAPLQPNSSVPATTAYDTQEGQPINSPSRRAMDGTSLPSLTPLAPGASCAGLTGVSPQGLADGPGRCCWGSVEDLQRHFCTLAPHFNVTPVCLHS
ncbi:hypothetical protein NHX12_002573 [Muraenolepis orangiensis]|uniref:Uncharacterized protein n=1 Tax=Muraenolepis orangiensis TaxID=630683 RepID=A0A9Q0DUR2_9TELE|nr:hypothetical protein NHX12_002573 [Muraenolepis orangiensis]